MKKILFYHVYLDGNYKLIIQEQLLKIFMSGLYAECDSIQLHIASPEQSRIQWLLDITKEYKKIVPTVLRIDRSHFPPDYRESKMTLHNLKKMADKVDGYYCYFHSKGVSNQGYIIDMWRNSCDYATICDWKKNIKMLDDGYDAVGPNLRYNTFLGYYPHFSGCYWWSTSKYIKTLKEDYLIDVKNKYLEEFWIGSGIKPLLGSTFECGHNEPYLIESSINKYIKVDDSAVLSAEIIKETEVKKDKNLVVVTSVIRNPVQSPYRTEKERLEETVKTVHSIKNNIPDSYIVILEGGTPNLEDAELLKRAGCASIFYQGVDGLHRSLGELTLLDEYFSSKYFLEIKDTVKTLNKISGRYFLNDTFSFDETKCCIKKNDIAWSGIGACSTRYWRVKATDINRTLNQLKVVKKNFGTYIDIEHAFYQYEVVPMKDMVDGEFAGVTGFVSPLGIWEDA
jgi:hypothetical protein